MARDLLIIVYYSHSS